MCNFDYLGHEFVNYSICAVSV